MRIRSPGLLIALVAAVPLAAAVAPYWKPGWDSAMYIKLAESIAALDGYRYLDVPHTKYPPGLPLLLAPIEALFGHQFLLMRLMIASFGIASVALAFRLGRERGSAALGAAAAIATAFSLAFVETSTWIGSGIPYMAVSFGALIAAERYRRDLTPRNAAVVAVLILAACTIRIVGVALAVAVIATLLVGRVEASRRLRLKHAGALLLVFAAAGAAWTGRQALITERLSAELFEGLSYQREAVLAEHSDPLQAKADLGEYGHRVARNARHYARLVPKVLSAERFDGTRIGYGIAALCVMAWGLAAWRRRGVVEAYAAVYGAVLLAWPAMLQERLIVPMLPILLLFLLEPLAGAARFIRTPAAVDKWVAGVFVLVMVALHAGPLFVLIRTEHREPYYQGKTGRYIEAIEWVGRNTPPDAFVVTDRSPWCYLLTGRRSLSFPSTPDRAKVLEALEMAGATHVVTSERPRSDDYLVPVIEATPERFRLLHAVGRSKVYEFDALLRRGHPQ